MVESFYQDPREAARVFYEYLLENEDDIPEADRKYLLGLLAPGLSIAEAITQSAEYMFARKSDLPKKAARVGAMLATTATYHNIHNFGVKGGERGNAIAAALRRHSGEKAPVGASWPKKESDPVPKDVYVAPPDSTNAIVSPPEPGTGSVSAPPLPGSIVEKGE